MKDNGIPEANNPSVLNDRGGANELFYEEMRSGRGDDITLIDLHIAEMISY